MGDNGVLDVSAPLVKVLHVYRTYFPDSQGGLEEVIRQICLSTRDFGVESRVFVPSRSPRPREIDGPEGKTVRVRQNFEIASCGFALGGLGEFRRQVAWADVVHYHFPWPFADLLHMAAGRPAASVVTYHSDIVRQQALTRVYRPLMNRFLGSVARIVATSPNYLATSDVLSRYRDKVDVIPIGIDEPSYPVPDSTLLAQVEAEFGRDFFLFVGVLRYYKGLHLLLQAMQGAAYPVVIVGAGPEAGALKRQAEKLGLENVRFGGYLPDATKMALFRLCRAVVFPSHLRAEAFGVTLLEAAMSGKPLISAEVGTGTSYINRDLETGLVVTAGSVAALREAMDRIAADGEAAQRMGLAARRRYEDLFTGLAMGRRYAELYREIAAARPDLAAECRES